MGDGLETEDTGAEETSLKAREALLETRTTVLMVGMEVSEGLCGTCNSALIRFFFGCLKLSLGNLLLILQKSSPVNMSR